MPGLSEALQILHPLSFINSGMRAPVISHSVTVWIKFHGAVRTANSDISSYMPLRRGRNTVFLQLLGPLNTEWGLLAGLCSSSLSAFHCGLTDTGAWSSMIIQREKCLLPDRHWWQGLPLPAGCDLGHNQTQHATGWIHFDEIRLFPS